MKTKSPLWLIPPVIVAVVSLLAMSRGANRNPPALEPTGAAAPVAATDSRAKAAPEKSADSPGLGGVRPRHVEIGFRSEERLLEHFHKHGRDFHANTPEQYLRLAQTLRDRPRSADVLEFVRNDAVTCKFDRSTGAFVAYNSDGTLRTFFRPNEGEAYFERQKSRAHDGP